MCSSFVLTVDPPRPNFFHPFSTVALAQLHLSNDGSLTRCSCLPAPPSPSLLLASPCSSQPRIDRSRTHTPSFVPIRTFQEQSTRRSNPQNNHLVDRGACGISTRSISSNRLDGKKVGFHQRPNFTTFRPAQRFRRPRPPLNR